MTSSSQTFSTGSAPGAPGAAAVATAGLSKDSGSLTTSQQGSNNNNNNNTTNNNSNSNSSSNNAVSWLQGQVLAEVKGLATAGPPSAATQDELCALVNKLVSSEYVFQSRARQIIRALIEDKTALTHKLAVLEQAAGIADKDTSDRLIDQLQRWQEDNERQRATIAYLKIRIQMLENAAAQQDEYYRRNVADMTRQHNEQLQAIFRRHEETEIAFLAYQKSTSEDLAELARLRQELASTEARLFQQQQQLQQQQKQLGTNGTGVISPGAASSSSSTGSSPTPSATYSRKGSKVLGLLAGGDVAQLQMELANARKKMQDLSAEKLTLTERLKLAEKLKDMKEQENNTLRDNMTQMRKAMQDDVMTQLKQGAQPDQDSPENEGFVYVQDEGGNKRLKGASPENLIERMIDPALHDHQFQITILLTHKTFTTSSNVLDIILSRLMIDNTVENPETLQLVSPKVIRAATVLKFWIENYWNDFLEDQSLIPKIQDSLKSIPEETANSIRTSLNRRLEFVGIPSGTAPSSKLAAHTFNSAAGLDFSAATTQGSGQKPRPILPKFLMKMYQNQLADGTLGSNGAFNTSNSVANISDSATGSQVQLNSLVDSSGVFSMPQKLLNGLGNDHSTTKTYKTALPTSDSRDSIVAMATAPELSGTIIKITGQSFAADAVTGPQAIVGPNGAFQDYGFGPTSTMVPSDGGFKQIKFLDIDPMEFARQLTLIEFDLFRTLKPREFMNLAWMKNDKEIVAPNIMRMMKWTNHIISWLITEIVSIRESPKLRIATLEKIISIGAALDKLNNFNGVKEVFAALNSASVYRLKKTQELMSTKYVKIHDDLAKLTSNEMNKKVLRNRIHSSDPPLIPFPGLYQGDLVFLDTCNKDKLDGGLINFYKLERVTSIVLEIEAYQQVGYNLEPVKEIQDYIKFFEILDEETQYSYSLQCEARSNN